MKDTADIGGAEQAYWEGRAESNDEIIKLKEVISECQQFIGSIGLHLRNAEYSKAMKEYENACERLERIYN